MGRIEGQKTFLITGGLGFIGSHFIDKCLKEGHKVINIDKKTYAANTNIKFEGDYHYIEDDIAYIEDIPFCDFIVNFAAESHVDNSIAENRAFIDSNFIGVHNLLEIIKKKKIDNMLHAWNYKQPIFFQVSTDEVFGDILEGAFREDDRHKASNPYSATKSAGEQIVQAWGRTYDIPWLLTRTTNNYGPRQHPEKLIPSAITRLLTGKRVMVHGDGRYKRNWIHVQDHVEAIWLVLDKGELSNAYHVASEEEFSVREIVSQICNALDKDYESNVDMSTDRSGVDVRYALNYEKITKLGWAPQRTMKDALPDIIDFYREKAGAPQKVMAAVDSSQC